MYLFWKANLWKSWLALVFCFNHNLLITIYTYVIISIYKNNSSENYVTRYSDFVKN